MKHELDIAKRLLREREHTVCIEYYENRGKDVVERINTIKLIACYRCV